MQLAAKTAWHQLHIDEVVELLRTSLSVGLSTAEAEQRLKEHGPNRVTARRSTPAWMKFLLQFHQPLIYILLASTVIAAAMGKWVDASVIFGVVFLNAIIGYFQEAKAEKAIEALAKMVVTEATVRRGGAEAADSLGAARAGRRGAAAIRRPRARRPAPADRRRNLHIEEAALTGESLPVEKQTEPLLR